MDQEQALLPTRFAVLSAGQDIQLLREIIVIANQAEDCERAMELSLPRLAQHCGCGVARAFLFAADAGDRVTPCQASYERVGGGLAGSYIPTAAELENSGSLRRVVRTGTPECSTMLGNEFGSAEAAGFRSALMIPVVAGADTFGVLTLFTERVIDCGRDALDTLAAVGVALGRVLERQRCRDAIQQSERLASMGTFAAGIAHELNNPLSSILVSARVARKQNYDQQRMQEVLGEIIGDAERCAQTVKNLVRFARREPGERTAVNVSMVLRRVVGIARSAAERNRVSLDVAIAEPLPPVLADATALEQALVNVVDSAVQASRPGGAVKVRANATDGDVSVIVVADDLVTTYPRTPLASQAREVTPALDMAREIITQHGGTIGIDTRPGVASTITVQLPVSGQSPKRASE